MPVKLQNFYPSPITIDGEDATVHVKRFDVDEFTKFERDYKRAGDPLSNRPLYVRRPEGEEQERDDKGHFKITAVDIAARRLAEMNETERAAYEKQDIEDEAFSKKFLLESLTAYITVPEGEITEDDVPVLTGAQLLRVFGARADVLRQLLTAIWVENTLSKAEKKVRRSLSGLSRSLNEQTLAVLGQIPVPTAEPAESAASVVIEDAMAPATIPSGSEAATSSL